MLRLLAFAFLSTAALSAPVPVSLDPTQGLMREGKPYFVKGAGGDTHLDLLAAHGANSLRTWSADHLDQTLAEAAKRGLTVSAGLWLEPECSWFSYHNPQHCEKQAARVKQQVESFRDHPALLAWGLGNEMEGDGSNADYWQQLDRLAVLIHSIDPAHPTFTAIAGISPAKAAGLNQHTPHLDYLGINTYGGLFALRKQLDDMGWKRPWLVTEWGAQGFWERPKHACGTPLEQTSSEKAAMMARGYDEVIAKGGGCLGSYAFVWEAKYEATATWFGLLTSESETTESVDVLQQRWTGKEPANHCPAITPMEGVPANAVAPGTSFQARVSASDPDGDPLAWRWAVLPEKPALDAKGQPQAPAPLASMATAGTATIAAPRTPGIYRIHVWVTDGHGHAATANRPLEVK